MAIYDLFGDTSGLPKTTLSNIPYEIEAVSPRETWGAGNGNTTITCRQTWANSAVWIADMVGTVEVVQPGGTPLLKRNVPEALGFGDDRVQFCYIVDQTEQGGNPTVGANFASANGWPKVLWVKYKAVFEAPPYAILTVAEQEQIQADAGAYAGAAELYRYVIRSRKTYSREQPIPGAGPAGGFKIAKPVGGTAGGPIGQVGFRVVSMADVTYKWVRVPIGWPPPIGYTGGVTTWPPVFNPVAAGPTTTKRARDAYIGSVNDAWFDCAAPDGYAWPPGSLLYTGYDDSNRYYDAAGDWVCDVVYSFKYKEGAPGGGGWNQFLDALGQWVAVTDNGFTTGNPPYKSNSFDSLFRYAAT